MRSFTAFRTVSLLVFMLCSSILYSQSYGVKGGTTISTINGQNQMDNLVPSIQLGGFANFGGDNPLYFRAELNLTHKGVRNWRGIEGFEDSRLNAFYAEFAVLFGIEITGRVTLNLGFQPAINMYSHHRYTLDGERKSGSFGSQMTLLDYSTLMGVEYYLNRNTFFGARYNHNFVPIQGRGGFLDKGGQEPTFMIFQLYVGHRLK